MTILKKSTIRSRVHRGWDRAKAAEIPPQHFLKGQTAKRLRHPPEHRWNSPALEFVNNKKFVRSETSRAQAIQAARERAKTYA